MIIVYSQDCEATALGFRRNLLADCEDKDVQLLVYDNGFAIYDTNRRILERAQTIVFVCSKKNLRLYRAHHPMHYLSGISQSNSYDARVTVGNEIQISRSRNPRFEFLLCVDACPQDFMEVFGVRCYTRHSEYYNLIKYINRSEIS